MPMQGFTFIESGSTRSSTSPYWQVFREFNTLMQRQPDSLRALGSHFTSERVGSIFVERAERQGFGAGDGCT